MIAMMKYHHSFFMLRLVYNNYKGEYYGKIMLNLNSLATMLCTCDLYAYDEAALTNDEWLEVEKNLKVHGLNGPSSLFGLNSDELMDILDISEYSAYKIVRRMKSIQFF